MQDAEHSDMLSLCNRWSVTQAYGERNTSMQDAEHNDTLFLCNRWSVNEAYDERNIFR